MGQVLLTLGNLFRIFDEPHVDAAVRECVHASLEKRWKQADQEVFILAVAFNPYVRESCFSDAALPRNTLAEICKRVFERVTRQSFSTAIWSAFMRYLQAEGRFSSAGMGLEYYRQASAEEGKDIDLVAIWEAIRCQHATTTTDIADHTLISFALRIVSVIANSGACERGFSGFGITHSRLRNRLAVQSTHDINLVRMHVEACHAAQGRMQPRKKRKLGPTSSTASIDSSSSTRSTESSAMPARDADRTAALTAAADDLLASDEVVGCDPTDIDAILDAIDLEDPLEDVPDVYPAGSSTYVKIPLAALFNYPESGSSTSSPLEFYWKGGIRDLENEEEVLEAAAGL